jgi:hypothetical protein
MKKILIILCAIVYSNQSFAAASQDDVKSIDTIIEALYDVISGSKDDVRDWERFNSLFDSDARLIFVSSDTPSGFMNRTPEQYAELANGSFVQNGFYEREISRDTEIYGHIAHVFSTYEGRRSLDSEPFLRGINSIQLAFNGERWFIETVFWQAENEQYPLPGKYLD